jgi:hypothetical protein
MKIPNISMRLLSDVYGVCRMDKNDPIPEWIEDSRFYSVTKTMEELSVVCPQNRIPDHIKCEKGWRILKVEGTLEFSLIGILSFISTVLANNGISIFAISTYDTDYILIKEKDTDKVISVLTSENYSESLSIRIEKPEKKKPLPPMPADDMDY